MFIVEPDSIALFETGGTIRFTDSHMVYSCRYMNGHIVISSDTGIFATTNSNDGKWWQAYIKRHKNVYDIYGKLIGEIIGKEEFHIGKLPIKLEKRKNTYYSPLVEYEFAGGFTIFGRIPDKQYSEMDPMILMMGAYLHRCYINEP